MLGELRIDTDPDCQKNGKGQRKCAPPKITREITSDDQIIVHEDYSPSNQIPTNLFQIHLTNWLKFITF